MGLDEVLQQRVVLVDETLRDGMQMNGVKLEAAARMKVAQALYNHGRHIIVGGWPGSKPAADEFFDEVARTRPEFLERLSVFGQCKHVDNIGREDPYLNALLQRGREGVPIATVFARSWTPMILASRSEDGMETTPTKVIESARETVAALKEVFQLVKVDLEFGYQGMKGSRNFVEDLGEALVEAGADSLVLCDTVGKGLPFEVSEYVAVLKRWFPDIAIGFHGHKDLDLAEANTLAAHLAGATVLEGNTGVLGEGAGNANLNAIAYTLQQEMGIEVMTPEQMAHMTTLTRLIYDLCGKDPDPHETLVGRKITETASGAHQANRRFYQRPGGALVGNQGRRLLSEDSGTKGAIEKAAEYGVVLDRDQARTYRDLVKENEARGYDYDEAEGSLELMARQASGQYEQFIDVEYMVGHRTLREGIHGPHSSEASIRLRIRNGAPDSVADGLSYDKVGPVDAINYALFDALRGHFAEELSDMELLDWRIRVLPPENEAEGTARKVMAHVDIRKGDQIYTFCGVNADQDLAGFECLLDAYNLFINQARYLLERPE